MTALHTIYPDSWKNIAFPVIQAFNLLINSSVSHFYRTHEISLNQETQHKKTQAYITKLEKESRKREDQIDDHFNRLEKNMTIAFNKFRVDLENQIQKSEIRVEEGYHAV